MGVFQNGGFIVENIIEIGMDDFLGYPYFRKPPYHHYSISQVFLFFTKNLVGETIIDYNFSGVGEIPMTIHKVRPRSYVCCTIDIINLLGLSTINHS